MGSESLNHTGTESSTHRWYTRPVFFVADIQRAERFYVDQLGFKRDWPADDAEWTVRQVSHGECEIILCQDDARTDRGRLFIELTSEAFADLRREFTERGVTVRETWWGYDCMEVLDPDGNALLFPSSD
jgi:catechol 2,3-dioxygenase-like lactoylglutathione lyase family enzyme